MSSGQVPEETSPTCATVIGPTQLSASSVIKLISAGGTAATHSTDTAGGAVAVGGVLSSTVIVCTTAIELPHASVTLSPGDEQWTSARRDITHMRYRDWANTVIGFISD